MTVGFLAHKRLQYDFDKEPFEFSELIARVSVPVEPRPTQHTWILSHRVIGQDISDIPNHINDVHSFLDTLPSWEQILLKEVNFIQSEEQVWESLQRGRC